MDLQEVDSILLREIGWMVARSVEFDDHLDGYRFIRSNGLEAFVFSSAVLGFTFRQQPVMQNVPRLEV